MAAPMLDQKCKLVGVEVSSPIRYVVTLTQVPGADSAREIEQRASYGRDRDAVVPSDVRGVQIA